MWEECGLHVRDPPPPTLLKVTCPWRYVGTIGAGEFVLGEEGSIPPPPPISHHPPPNVLK